MTTTPAYSIHLLDSKMGLERELYFADFAQAAKRLDEMHQWARNNSYAPGRDYTLTLSAI